MTKKLLLVLMLLIFAANFAFTQNPTAAQLLQRIDANEVFNTIQYEGEMVIIITLRNNRERRDVKTMNVWQRGTTDSFIVFTNPEERGHKYLRTDAGFWFYAPDNERIMEISSHQLNWMGSDLSFEDSVENEPLARRYDAVITGSDTINTAEGRRETWVLELNVKPGRTESYPRRKLWIDKQNGDLLRAEMYALNRTQMLKEYNVLRVEVIGGRRFPVEIEVRDRRRQNTRTVVTMRNVVIDRPIDPSVFTTRNLTR